MKRETRLLLALLLLAFGLRVWRLAEHNIWWDEGVSTWLVRRPVGAILDWTAHDVHPPLYYLLLKGWWLLSGEGEFVLRFPSVVAGVLGVAVAYGLGRALGGRRAGLLTALFLALSRFAVSWSQEMRMYIWAALLATGALWAAFRLWEGRGRRAWLAYVLTTAGGLWTLYLTISVPIIANLAFPVVWLRKGRPRRLLVRWATAQLTAALLYLPWLAYALPRIPTWSTAEPFPPSLFIRLYATMLTMGVSVNLEAYALPVLAAFAVLVPGLVVLWRIRHRPEQAAGLAMLLLGLTLPAAVVYIVSLPIHIYYSPRIAPRYLLPLSACYYGLLGWGLATLARERRWMAGAGLALVVGVAVGGLASFYPDRVRRDDYIGLAAALRDHRQPGDEVVLHTDRDWPVFAAHYAGTWRGVPFGAPMDPEAADALLRPLWGRSEGVWLVITPDALRADPHQAVRSWLEARAVASATWEFGESTLTLYARTAERAASLYDLGPDFVPPDGPRAEIAPGVLLLGARVPLPRYRTGDVVHLSLYWDRPPEEGITVEMEGEVRREAAFGPPPAHVGPTRQQIDLLLTPDLPGGRYRLLLRVDGGQAVEVGRFALVRRTPEAAVAPEEIPHPLDLRLGESIRLVGYDLPRAVVEPGGVVELTLYWQAMEPVGERYKVFTHLMGRTYNAATGNLLWGQQDNEPVNGQVPTTQWPPGVVIADPYRIPVAPNAPPGLYTVEVGLYGLVDGERLPVFGPDGEPLGDAVILTQVEVRSP